MRPPIPTIQPVGELPKKNEPLVHEIEIPLLKKLPEPKLAPKHPPVGPKTLVGVILGQPPKDRTIHGTIEDGVLSSETIQFVTGYWYIPKHIKTESTSVQYQPGYSPIRDNIIFENSQLKPQYI